MMWPIENFCFWFLQESPQHWPKMPLKSRKVLLILIWAKTNKDREQVSKHGFTFISYQCSTFFVFLVFEVFLYLKKFSEIS